VTDNCSSASGTIAGDVDPFTYDNDNSVDVISQNSQGTVYVVGGIGPFNVAISGQNFFLDPEHTMDEGTTTSRTIGIYTTTSCGSCSITVTDSCGLSVNGNVRSNGHWTGDCYIYHISNDRDYGSGAFNAATYNFVNCSFSFAGYEITYNPWQFSVYRYRWLYNNWTGRLEILNSIIDEDEAAAHRGTLGQYADFYTSTRYTPPDRLNTCGECAYVC
jgi:hypothetical protein